MKGSQVLAAMARLDCRQFHRRSASGALRALVLSVEHVSPSRGMRFRRYLNDSAELSVADNCRGRARWSNQHALSGPKATGHYRSSFKIVGKGNDARVGLTTPGAIRSNADIQAITFLISNSVHPVW
jgi:hypothetical protein